MYWVGTDASSSMNFTWDWLYKIYVLERENIISLTEPKYIESGLMPMLINREFIKCFNWQMLMFIWQNLITFQMLHVDGTIQIPHHTLCAVMQNKLKMEKENQYKNTADSGNLKYNLKMLLISNRSGSIYGMRNSKCSGP